MNEKKVFIGMLFQIPLEIDRFKDINPLTRQAEKGNCNVMKSVRKIYQNYLKPILGAFPGNA